MRESYSSSSPTPSPEKHEDSLEKSDYSVVVTQMVTGSRYSREMGVSGVEAASGSSGNVTEGACPSVLCVNSGAIG